MKSKKPAFTLVEILIVVAIIVVLLGMTTQMIGAASDSQSKKRAVADMAIIATALEKFNATYGDYPRLSCAEGEKANAIKLYQCLTGKMYMTVEDSTIVFKELNDTTTREPFLNVSQMNLANITDDEDVDSDDANVFLVDPWGEPYLYIYNSSNSTNKNDATWESPKFILLSKGADMKSAGFANLYTDGIMEDVVSYKAIGVNADNIVNGID